MRIRQNYSADETMAKMYGLLRSGKSHWNKQSTMNQKTGPSDEQINQDMEQFSPDKISNDLNTLDISWRVIRHAQETDIT